MEESKNRVEKLALKALDYEIHGFVQPPFVKGMTRKCQKQLKQRGIVLPKMIYSSDAEYLLILADELKKTKERSKYYE